MKKLNVIAIDGPAGSGKSTIAKNVAKELNYLYIDTGAMYRALTLKAINKNLDLYNEKALVDLSHKTKIELKDLNGVLQVYLDGEDVSRAIRTMEVTTKVKLIASLPGVRKNMVKLQRLLGTSSKGAVLEGRDIGTAVFPNALYKIYLDADLDVRVKRRYDELKAKKFEVSPEEVKEDLLARDKSDMTREAGPLVKAKDAVVLDTTGRSIKEVSDKVLEIVRKS